MTAPATPTPITSPSASSSGGVVLVVLVLGLTAALAAATWMTTGLGSDGLARIVSIGGGLIAVVATALVGRRVGSTAARRLAVVAMVVLALGIILACDSGTLQTRKIAADLPAWTATAERALADAGPPPTFDCHDPAPDQAALPTFGRVDQICVDNSTSERFRWVSFTRGDGFGWAGVIYQPDGNQPDVMSQCIAHLDGPWWQTAQADPNCPDGFVFLGGG